MPSLGDQLGSLISSLIHAITAVFGSILAVLQSVLNAIIGVFQTAFAAVGTTISGLFHTFEGLFQFLLSNILVIGALVAAFFLYAVYQQRSGRSVTATPATTKKIN